MAELPIMPVKTDALLADTTHMSAEEFGAYCRILFAMWRQGGKLVADATELSFIAGVSPRRWRAISEKVMRPLTVINGEVSQKRLMDTMLRVRAIREKRVGAASKRWSKRNASALQMHCTSNANQTKTIDITSSSSVTKSEGLSEKVLVVSPELASIVNRRPC